MQDIQEKNLEKGESMEERLRSYFLELGYYVLRGPKLKFQGVEVTDIDLWIYHRSTPLSRERINVDIKNKVKPAAVERIIVAKGIMNILGFDRCIVATTDVREDVIDFGEKNGVRVLNKHFLDKLTKTTPNRYSEETFNFLLNDQFSKFTTNWFAKNEAAKSKLIEDLDFATANELLVEIYALLIQIHSTPLKKEVSCRLLYLFVSYLFITVDFILKDYAFIEHTLKVKNLESGFKYGVVGSSKAKVRIDQIAKQSGKSPQAIRSALDAIPVKILSEFFGKNETAKNLFQWSKDLETLAYSKILTFPATLSSELKGAIGLLCDFSGVDRKHVFDA